VQLHRNLKRWSHCKNNFSSYHANFLKSYPSSVDLQPQQSGISQYDNGLSKHDIRQACTFFQIFAEVVASSELSNKSDTTADEHHGELMQFISYSHPQNGRVRAR